MTHTKRKTTKKKTYRSKNRKKHFNSGAFFTIVVCVLSVAIIYYFYQHEQEKRKTGENTQTSNAPDPSTPRIIDYTNLTYPVSYSSQPEQIIFHTGHTVSYNKNWKIPNWVSYELTADETKGEEKRHNKFTPDPFITEGIVTTADYRNSGYDRGHMAPAADMKWSGSSMKASFYLSNICPQHPKLNQRRWKDLENNVRKWAIADSAIIVISGPIVKNPPPTYRHQQDHRTPQLLQNNPIPLQKIA